MPKNKTALRLTESAMMIAAATILSFVKLVDLPAGGSITLASMLPILLIAYRYGWAWGTLCGLVHGTIQFVIGSSVLSYVTGAASVCAVILLDYIVAFAVIGLGGIMKKVTSSQTAALVSGAVVASVLRYVCHVISGCTVWAGLSIPTADALGYSFIYNATYMLPEMLILMVVAYYVSTALDFASPRLAPAKKEASTPASRALFATAGAVICAGVVFDIAAVFAKLQNAETGEFDVTAITTVPWVWVICVSAAAAVIAAVLFAVKNSLASKNSGK